MILRGALVCFVGSWGLMLWFAGIHLGVSRHTGETYSLTPVGVAGAVLFVGGLALVVRGVRARRRENAERDAARVARRAHQSPSAGPGPGDALDPQVRDVRPAHGDPRGATREVGDP